ncbi:sugar-binding protein [Clostridium neuense]|uniref:Sugar-binding protein n=1 Tax=Clostridium neuense TaxID=1728934 RepID=A0ABW8TKU2_9CLOT
MMKINKLFIQALIIVSCIIIGTSNVHADTAVQEDKQGTQITSYKTSLSPTIDGDLSDAIWQNRPFTPLANRYKNDGESLKADFKTAWDDKYFYVAANMKEKNIKDGGTIWSTDEVSIFIDANNSKTQSYKVPYDVQIGVGYGSTEPVFAFGGGASGRDASKIQRACKKTADGWSLEVAIPFETLGVDPNKQQVMGFDIAADTNDGTTKFWSNTETTDSWRYTSGFGTLILSPSTLQDKKVSVSGITLDNNNLSLYKGQTVTITPTILPLSASDKSVIWTSSDNNVVAVTDGNAPESSMNDISNNSAILTAKNSGTATITAATEDGSKTAVCTVTVLDGNGTDANDDVKIDVTNEKNVALGQNALVSVSAQNNSYNIKNATLVVALYDSQNKMIDIETSSDSIDPEGTSYLAASVNIPSTGKYTLKYFVCDDLENLTPLNTAVVRTIQ